MVDILVTGENRNPALFMSQIDIWLQLSERSHIPITVTYAWPYKDSKRELRAALLAKRVELYEVETLPESKPTWDHQAYSLKQLLSNVKAESFVLKTRPDVYLSPELFLWLLENSQNWPLARNPNIEHKIWTPWAHTFYPFLLDEKAFAGFAKDLFQLSEPDRSEWRRLFADSSKEAHVRRWIRFFENSDRGQEFIQWFESYSPSRRISPHTLDKINKIQLGDWLYKKFAFFRVKDFLSNPTIQESYLDYLKTIEDSIFFYDTYDSCKNAYIDKWGPFMDSFASKILGESFFLQNDYPWVFFSENCILEKFDSSNVLTNNSRELALVPNAAEIKHYLKFVKLYDFFYRIGIRRQSFLTKAILRLGVKKIINSRLDWKESFFPW